LDLAQRHPEHLFILKGKKGELGYMTSNLHEMVMAQPNIYVIFSKKPRLLKYNQFEDLLLKSDIVVSMSHTSTTIWQALRLGLPAIAINNAHDHSFLRNYPHFEVRIKELPEAFVHWTTLDKKSRDTFFANVFKVLNISEDEPFDMMADGIAMMNRDAETA